MAMYCFHPIMVKEWYEGSDGKKHQSSHRHLVPCGKCVACLSRRRNEWTYRCSVEQLHSDYTYFGTLTYDDKHCPVRIVDNVPYLVFNKDDVQKYIKRVRYFINKIDPDIKTSYYLVSEYGSNGKRPHYHFLFFVKNDKYLQRKKQIDMILRGCWQKGFVTFKPANDANIHYVTKYCIKNLEELPPGCIDPVFILVSKNPYIGSSHEETLERQTDLAPNYEPKVFIHGMPNAMPRIFRQKLNTGALHVENAVQCDFLSRSTEEAYARDYLKSHDSLDSGFTAYCWQRNLQFEKAAIKRQLKRNEKL